jgi:phospholipid/cholesterol/gamma-HCH transport system ATP-binding protein
LALEQWTELPHDAIAAVVLAKLRMVGLVGSEDKFPAEISGGMKKRARYRARPGPGTSLLFPGRALAGLDPVSAVELDELILTMSRGST